MKQKFIKYFNNHIAPKKEAERQASSPEDILRKLEIQHEKKACEIARKGNYSEIVKNLENHDFLLEQMSRIQEEYGSILDQATFLFQEDSLEIWKALTTLELYDKETFKHCLRTYEIAKSKIESPINIDRQAIDLKKMITNESMTGLDHFYKACLLHDIGKIEVPYFLVASEIKNSEWAELLLDFDEKNRRTKPWDGTLKPGLLEMVLADAKMDLPSEIRNRSETTAEQREEKKGLILKFLTENDLRCAPYVPISQAINNPLLGLRSFSPENIRELKRRGHSPENSLLDILKSHEKNSKEILEKLNLKNEAELVGAHHDYEGLYKIEYAKHPLTLSSLSLSERMAELLRIADMHEAIHSGRAYTDKRSQIESLIILAKSINNKKIHPLIAYIWLSDELQKIGRFENLDPEKVATLERHISAFEKNIDLKN